MKVTRFLMTVIWCCVGMLAFSLPVRGDYTKFDFENDAETVKNANENVGENVGENASDGAKDDANDGTKEGAQNDAPNAPSDSVQEPPADANTPPVGNDESTDQNAETNENAGTENAENANPADANAPDSEADGDTPENTDVDSSDSDDTDDSDMEESPRNSKKTGRKRASSRQSKTKRSAGRTSRKTRSGKSKTAVSRKADAEQNADADSDQTGSGVSSEEIPIEDLMGAGTDHKTRSHARSKRTSKRSEDRRTTRSKSRKKRGEAEMEAAAPKEEKQRDVHEKMQVTKLESMKLAFPENHLIYYESVHFFFLTDAPQKIAVECIEYLEDAYNKLQNAFHMPTVLPVWQGKCMVVAFSEKANFVKFETKFYNTEKKFLLADALTHLTADGNVLISTYYGDMTKKDRRWLFLATMMHEMSHGFVFRYKNRNPLPLWLDEGLADHMAKVMVPKSPFVAAKQKEGLALIKSKHSIGGLFKEEKQLLPWQYGVASSLVAYMLKTNPTAFGPLIDRIKTGEKWETALKATYRCTPEELLQNFGRANGISELKP